LLQNNWNYLGSFWIYQRTVL